MAAKLRDGVDAEIFKSLCDDLLMASLPETYNAARDTIHQFINEKPERGFLKTWVDWWDHRRTFNFRAFNPGYAPKMNLAEVVHASWAHRDRPNMSLLDAAQADTRDSILLEAELEGFENGSFKGGKGRTVTERRKKTHRQEITRASQLGKEMSALRGNMIDPSSAHRPPAPKKVSKAKRSVV